MLTLVISLPHAAERQRRISSDLNSAGLPFSIVQAVVGRNLTKTEVATLAPSRFRARLGRDLTLGEIGCTLSHKAALETFLLSSETTALILEDDALVPPNLAAMIEQFATILPTGWGILKIGGMGGFRGKVLGDTNFGRIVDTAAPTIYAHAYVVSRLGAEQLLRKILPVRLPYDLYMRDTFLHHALTFEVVPPVVHQAISGDSSLATERSESMVPFGWRHVMFYPAWKFSHELRRRAYLARKFGLTAAIFANGLPRHT
jgi:glycosyl transferase family 25